MQCLRRQFIYIYIYMWQEFMLIRHQTVRTTTTLPCRRQNSIFFLLLRKRQKHAHFMRSCVMRARSTWHTIWPRRCHGRRAVYDLWPAFISWTISAHNFAYSITFYSIRDRSLLAQIECATIDCARASLICDCVRGDCARHAVGVGCGIARRSFWWKTRV